MQSIQAMQMHSVKTKGMLINSLIACPWTHLWYFYCYTGDEELVSFLAEEIATERKTSQPLPRNLEEFESKFEESVLTLTKKFNDEL